MKLLKLLSAGLPSISMLMRPKPQQPRKRRRLFGQHLPFCRQFEHIMACEQLEARALLSITANNCSFNASSATGLTVDAPGVLAYCTDSGGYTMSAHLLSGPSNLTIQSDGEIDYTGNGSTGYITAQWDATDTQGSTSNVATLSLTVELGIVTAVNSTKVAVDTINVSRQILSDPWPQSITSPLPAGGSGGTIISPEPADGAPATAHNLSLQYNSIAQTPDQVLEGDFALAMNSGTYDSLSVSATFDGQAAGTSGIGTQYLGNNPTVHVAIQVSTSAYPTGYYPYTLTLGGSSVYAPATVSGYVAVVNNSASPFGAGWDMPGLDHLYQNNVSGAPAGMLLTDGTGEGWFFTENDDGSFTSPNGPYAFDTLTSVTGGGWQLVTHDGVTFNFNSSGYVTSRVDRTGTTTYSWTSGELVDITDPFGRSIVLAYSSGLLSSISDFAANSYTFGMTGSDLTSITEPNAGYSTAPEWEYAYSAGYMSSETDPNGNQTSFILDSYHRLSRIDLPGGATTGDTSEQDFGYGGQYYADPATLTSSVIPSTTTPDGNTSDYQTNQFGETISETDPYGNTETIQRDVNGLPTVITLPPPATGDASPVTDIYYTSTGDETYATGASPTYGTYTYSTDSFGQWATFTDSTGKEWARTFDTSGDILTETDPSGSEVSWTYNSYGEPLTMTVPAPNNASGTETTSYYYDAYGRLDEILWPDNSTQLFGSNADDYQTTFTNEDSATTTTTYDVLNRPTSVENALNGLTYTTYDKDNNVLSTQDEMGNVTSDQYNARNELVQQTLPPPAQGDASPVLAWTYDADGNELTYTDALGRVTTYTWDKLDRMASETLPPPAQGKSGPETTFAYDNDSRKVSGENALSGTTSYAYANTDISQLTSVTLPPPSGTGQGPTTSYGFDADGRQDSVTDAMNHTTTTSFTADGEVSQTEDSLSNITSYVYGNGGELLSTTDPLNHTSSDEYDSRYRLVQTTDANSGVTSITLDPAGNETKLVDSDNNATSWVFDLLNRPTSETNALGTTTTAYNADSEITSIEDADGRVRDFSYDDDQNLTAENWMSGSTVVATMAYGYDLDNELTSASDPNSAYAFTYDGDGDALTVDNKGTPNVPDVVLSSAYDALGDRTSLAATIAGSADFINSYGYDGDQDLTVVQQQQQSGGNTVANKEIDYAYNALGQFTAMAYYDELSGPRTDIATGAFSYDTDNRLTGLGYTADGGQSTIDAYGWAYNAGSLVTSFTTNEGTASYGYAPTNQLTSASYTGTNQPANESYSFTKNGNRDMSGYSTGSDNLTSSDGTYNYGYDADGNLVSRTQIANTYSTDYKTIYTWDYRNRLTDVENYDNNGVLTQHVHYVFDVFDHLIATEVDTTGDGTYNVIDHYVLDVTPEIPAAGVPGTATAQPVLVFNGSEQLIGRNLVAPNAAGDDAVGIEGTVTSLTQADTDQYNMADDLGSLRIIMDNASAILDEINYNSAGQVAYESNASIVHFAGFAGGHVDYYTALDEFYHRFYNPDIEKWLTPDPEGFAGGDENLSQYVGNDPTNFVDTHGLFPVAPQTPQQQQQQQSPRMFMPPNTSYNVGTRYPVPTNSNYEFVIQPNGTMYVYVAGTNQQVNTIQPGPGIQFTPPNGPPFTSVTTGPIPRQTPAPASEGSAGEGPITVENETTPAGPESVITAQPRQTGPVQAHVDVTNNPEKPDEWSVRPVVTVYPRQLWRRLFRRRR
jgi:RHS repeat-associated protein